MSADDSVTASIPRLPAAKELCRAQPSSAGTQPISDTPGDCGSSTLSHLTPMQVSLCRHGGRPHCSGLEISQHGLDRPLIAQGNSAYGRPPHRRSDQHRSSVDLRDGGARPRAIVQIRLFEPPSVCHAVIINGMSTGDSTSTMMATGPISDMVAPILSAKGSMICLAPGTWA